MSSKEIEAYYEATTDSEVRHDLVTAADLVRQSFAAPIAIDCGCGAGSDIQYLLDKGFEIFAFDIEPTAIDLCTARFAGAPDVHLQRATFKEYSFPKAQLVVADASLFFCPPRDFASVWQNICDALPVGGVFTGSWLGERDTMAAPQHNAEVFWPDVMTITEPVLKNYLGSFEIVHWQEHELDGKTAQGIPHHWHIFSVVAKKIDKS